MLDKSRASELLTPYKGVISTSIRSAILDWQKVLAEVPDWTGGLGGRTRSSFIHDRTVYRLRAEEPNHPGLRLKKIRGLQVLIVHDELVLKLKKLDAKLRSNNVPTIQTSLFNAQGVLEGTTSTSTKATAGYTLDALNALPTRLVVVCWEGSDRLWTVDLDEGEEGIVYEIDAEPKDASSSAQTRTRVKDEHKPGEATDSEE